MNLWLDDVRSAPPGWIHVKTVAEAQHFLCLRQVDNLSLDHDLGTRIDILGVCPLCTSLGTSANTSYCPYCQALMPDGTELVNWMERTGNWSKIKPMVHSANIIGRQRMLRAIEHSFPHGD